MVDQPFGYTLKTKYRNLRIFNPFFPLFWQIENPLESLHFSIFDLNFSFWQKKIQLKKRL
jgi:hypothetical protein